MLAVQSKKTDYDTKVNELKKITDYKHDKYITTPEFNKLTRERFAQANLVTKMMIKYQVLIRKLLHIKQGI